MFALAPLLALALVAMLGLQPAHAAGDTLDQSQTYRDADLGMFTFSYVTVMQGQTFTAGLSGNLDRVELQLGVISGPGDLNVSIYDTSGGLPTGSPLATTTVSSSSIAYYEAWQDVYFNPAPVVTAGHQYAIGLEASLNSDWSASAADNNPYAGGTMLQNISSVPGGWQEQPGGWDMLFKTYVETQQATTTTLTSSANPSDAGQQVTLTAQVTVQSPGTGDPTGSVTFSDNGSPITCASGNQTLSSGTATCGYAFSSAGAHSVTASYGGDANFAASTSSALTQNVDTSLSGYPSTGGVYNLHSASLSGAYLYQANLAASNLQSADLSGATLTQANLSGANLNSANLSGADLTGANLQGANLKGANLTGANLSGATGMASANLNGVTWSNTTCPDGSNSTTDGGSCLGHL